MPTSGIRESTARQPKEKFLLHFIMFFTFNKLVWANPADSLISSADLSGHQHSLCLSFFENRLGSVQVQKRGGYEAFDSIRPSNLRTIWERASAFHRRFSRPVAQTLPITHASARCHLLFYKSRKLGCTMRSLQLRVQSRVAWARTRKSDML